MSSKVPVQRRSLHALMVFVRRCRGPLGQLTLLGGDKRRLLCWVGYVLAREIQAHARPYGLNSFSTVHLFTPPAPLCFPRFPKKQLTLAALDITPCGLP